MCDKWRGPSTRLSAWAAQIRRRVGERSATVSVLTGPGIELKTTRADSDVFHHYAKAKNLLRTSTRRHIHGVYIHLWIISGDKFLLLLGSRKEFS